MVSVMREVKILKNVQKVVLLREKGALPAVEIAEDTRPVLTARLRTASGPTLVLRHASGSQAAQIRLVVLPPPRTSRHVKPPVIAPSMKRSGSRDYVQHNKLKLLFKMII
jgi:hypothetical protein